MWKSGFCLTAVRLFYSHPLWNFFTVFHNPCEQRFSEKVFHSKFSTFHSPCGIYFSYKQLLILAVISRILFCSSASPSFKSISTLRMLYSTVV